MADKLKIDLNSLTSANSTRPPSVAPSGTGSVDVGLNEFESFKGMGNTLNGKKAKGKGKNRLIEEVDQDSKIFRTE